MTDRIRVLRIIARMNVGGPALQVSTLAHGLDPDRFVHRILTGAVGQGEHDYRALRDPDVAVEEVPGLGRSLSPLDDARVLGRLIAVIRAFAPDVVHTHTAKAGVLGRLAAFRCGVPVTVHTFHGHLLHGYFSAPVTAAVVRAERALARRTTALVAVGAKVRDELVAAGIGRAEQYQIVPPGVPVHAHPMGATAARRALGIPTDAKVVVFIARLTGVKRPDRLAAVAHEVCRRTPDAVFLVVGAGPLEESTRAALAPLGDRARMLGWRSDVDVIYTASDLALLTSDNEGTPVALIEAAMCGVPAVATEVGSTAEVVRHGEGGLLAPANVAALAEAVSALLENDALRRQMGDAARRHALAAYGPARLVSDTAELYERLVGGANSSGRDRPSSM